MRKRFYKVIICLSVIAVLTGCGKSSPSAAGGKQVADFSAEKEDPLSTPTEASISQESQVDTAHHSESDTSEHDAGSAEVDVAEKIDIDEKTDVVKNPDVAEKSAIEGGYYVYNIEGYTFRIKTNLDDYLYHRAGKSYWSVDLKGIAAAYGFTYPYEGDGAAPLERQVRFDRDGWHIFFDYDGIHSTTTYYDVVLSGVTRRIFRFSRIDLDNDSITSYWIGNRSENTGKTTINFEQIVIYTYLLENYDDLTDACDRAGIDAKGIVMIDR